MAISQLECRDMKMKRIYLTLIITFMLAGCAGMPSLIMPHQDDKPAYARGGSGSASAPSRAPLDVPPSLVADVEVPMPEQVSVDGVTLVSAQEMKSIAGKAVSLEARLYDLETAKVFSSVIDALTSLNRPVQSVDSPSGTVTTDWIRRNVDNSIRQNISSIFGGDGVQATRYRFIIRVFRQKVEGVDKTRLEIRTLGQGFINRHWVNRSIKRKVSEDLFSAIEERLEVMQRTPENLTAE
ncbi:MAG: hypothetical protein R8K22_03355 [Mariprofundaceae bacterium]